jgi:signal transduction histidine kinase
MRRVSGAYLDLCGVGAIVAACAAYVVLSGHGLITEGASRAVSDILMSALPAIGGAFAFAVGWKRRDRARRGWLLLGAWGVLSASGNAVYIYYDLILHHAVPLPSLADAGYLGGNICAIFAIATFAIVPERVYRLRSVLDGILIAASVFVVSWALVLATVYHGSSDALFAKAVGLAYPVVDIIIVSLIVFAASRPHGIERSSLLMIGIGLVGWAFADTGFAYLSTINAYHPGGPVDVGWIGGDALIALAGFIALRRRSVLSETKRPAFAQWRLFLPYVVAGIALVTGVLGEIFRAGIDLYLLGALIVLLVVVVARQFLSVLESKSMTIEQMHSIDEMKDGILHAVSHELRTPLTVIKGFAEMIRSNETISREQTVDLLDRLLRNCDRLEEFLTGLLDLERLNRGVLEPARRRTDVGGSFLHARELIYAPNHTIRINVTGVWAMIDPAQTERIVENLLVNGVRHTPPGTTIVAEAQRVDGGVLITVTDDGKGVPSALKEEIFHPFTQGPDSGDMGNGKGTGIGLALVSKFAQLHGGRAWVEDAPGSGAKFCVFLADDMPASEDVDLAAAS